MDLVTVRFTSVSPILMSNPAAMRRSGDAPGVKRIPTPEAEAESLVYRLPEGQLYVPSDWFRSAGLQACKGLRIGKSAAAMPYKAGLFLTDLYCPLFDPDTDEPIDSYDLDTRRCVIQRQGVLRTRPRIERWRADAIFEHDSELISLDNVLELFARAGKIIGVGGYRVERGGPFGRFTAEIMNAAELQVNGEKQDRKPTVSKTKVVAKANTSQLAKA